MDRLLFHLSGRFQHFEPQQQWVNFVFLNFSILSGFLIYLIILLKQDYISLTTQQCLKTVLFDFNHCCISFLFQRKAKLQLESVKSNIKKTSELLNFSLLIMISCSSSSVPPIWTSLLILKTLFHQIFGSLVIFYDFHNIFSRIIAFQTFCIFIDAVFANNEHGSQYAFRSNG